MKALIHAVLLFSCSLNAASGDLIFRSIHTFPATLEISGLARIGNGLFAVSDNKSDTDLLELSLNGDESLARSGLSLKSLKGYWPYYLKALLWKQGGRWIKSPWDVEGISVCAGSAYIVNEQVRHLLKLEDDKLSKVPLEVARAFESISSPLGDIPTNAGFEGVAVDCSGQTVYLAQERQPRAILKFDLKTGQFIGAFSTPEKGISHPDYADLFFSEGFLYVLERNERRILKIETKEMKVISSVTYKDLNEQIKTKDLYVTGKPYGLGEALYMDKKTIYIGMDNNGTPFSEEAKKAFGLEKKPNGSSLILFSRPKDF